MAKTARSASARINPTSASGGKKPARGVNSAKPAVVSGAVSKSTAVVNATPTPGAAQAVANAVPADGVTLPADGVTLPAANPALATATSALETLLKIEREIRLVRGGTELTYMMVNEGRALIRFRQAFFLQRSGSSRYALKRISSISTVDRNTSFASILENAVRTDIKTKGAKSASSFSLTYHMNDRQKAENTYPFAYLFRVPMATGGGHVYGQLVFARENDWPENDCAFAERLAETYSHAYVAHAGSGLINLKTIRKPLVFAAILVLLAGLGIIQVPMNALAPAEITASNPTVVTAPIDGVLRSIAVSPYQTVGQGERLVTFDDTDARNRFEIAGREVEVAQARYQEALRSSFNDAERKRELATVRSELKLKAAEYDFASDLLKKTIVNAVTSGIAVFADKDEWIGRPVHVGERIMRIADPSQVNVTIQLPVSDAIVLHEGAEVKLFLDSDPLKPIHAKLTVTSYQATPDQENVLSYKVYADLNALNGGKVLPRIGLRGTAQIFGDDVSLAFFLFRRPISTLRQWLGL